MEQEIKGVPVSMFQIPLFADLAVTAPQVQSVGACYLRQDTAGQPPFFVSFGTSYEPAVKEINLGTVTEFTVQMLPTMNPVLVLVFSDRSSPSLKDDPKFICATGYDVSPYNIAAPGNVACNQILAGQKFMTSGNSFGPYKLPGNFKYMKAYQLFYQLNTAISNGIRSLADVNPGTYPFLSNLKVTAAFVNVYGF